MVNCFINTKLGVIITLNISESNSETKQEQNFGCNTVMTTSYLRGKLFTELIVFIGAQTEKQFI
jgi:hypothetical protein